MKHPPCCPMKSQITKRPDFFNFFPTNINRVNVWDGHVWCFTSTLLTFKIRGPLMFEQHWCIQKPQTSHLIELNSTPLLHTPQGHLFASTGIGGFCVLTMIFVLPTFTCRRFDSKLVFQTQNFSNNSSSVSAMMTRSSTYRSSQGQPVWMIWHDSACMTMINRSSLKKEPFCTPN